MTTGKPNRNDLQPGGHPNGFTLLELLVAMLLVTLVTLIATMAFRLSLQAWERGAAEGESRQIQTALPVLLEKQLAARVVTPLFGQLSVNPDSYFCGSGDFLSFLTAYAPQGSILQGMQWIRYVYDPDEKTLAIYQLSVTRPDDLNSGRDGRSSVKPDGLAPVSEIQDITYFRLAYSGEPMYDPDKDSDWLTDWKCGADTAGVPFGVMLEMKVGEGPRSRIMQWFYRIRTAAR